MAKPQSQNAEAQTRDQRRTVGAQTSSSSSVPAGSIRARLLAEMRKRAEDRGCETDDPEPPDAAETCATWFGADCPHLWCDMCLMGAMVQDCEREAEALSPQPSERLEVMAEYARIDAHEIHRLFGKATALEQALRRIVALDLGRTNGKDDFYTGPDRFFQAHQIARHALGGDAAALSPPSPPHTNEEFVRASERPALSEGQDLRAGNEKAPSK